MIFLSSHAMERGSLVVALALTLPLAMYGIPYAYAATVGQTIVVFADQTIAATDSVPYELFAHCPAGDYATGGGAGSDVDSNQLAPTFSGPAVGTAVDFGSAPPDGWHATFNFNPSLFVGGVVEVFVVCQAPITVAGIGAPEFGSLYVAIALGAVVYFVLSRRVSRGREGPAAGGATAFSH